MSTKLYVGNLSYDTTEDALRDHFAGDGREVSEVAIITDRDTGRSRGFAFVTMGSEEQAQAAMQELNGTELEGRSLKIDQAREREPRRGGGGGGGGFRGRRR